MRRLSTSTTSRPACHLSHVSGPIGSSRGATAVWICEYPYRTIRLAGPSSECSDCPVWRAMEEEREAAACADAEVRELEIMAS